MVASVRPGLLDARWGDLDGLRRSTAARAKRVSPGDIGPEVPVDGCFRFVEAEGSLANTGLPLVRILATNGYPLFYPRYAREEPRPR